MDKTNHISRKSKIALYLAVLVMTVFLVVKMAVFLEIEPSTSMTRGIELVCFLAFIPIFGVFVKDYLKKNKEDAKQGTYLKKLNDVLITQSHNHLFYEGDVTNGSKELVKEVTSSISTDRCSIWLYNEDKSSILCEQLYIKAEDTFYQGIELFKKDFNGYFEHLILDPIIVANDAETHPATKCFADSYLKPLGIKSMLDVPIIYKGEVIGVICIESLTSRSWEKVEVDFAQMLSSLYSFAYSVKESNLISKALKRVEVEIRNRMNAINKSNAVIEFELDGKIIYANEMFLQITGYSESDLTGCYHKMFVGEEYLFGNSKSKEYKDFWKRLRQGEYISGEFERTTKGGKKIWLQASYNPIIDESGKVYKIMKIATDITTRIEQSEELEQKNTYLEHAAKILRHDMHSGINTYIPRGVSSLERRLTEEDIKRLKLEAPLKMIKEGLKHTQKVYKGVYEFTNLVKKDVVLSKTECDIKVIISDYLSSTSYKSQVILDDNLPTIEVNESLFCTSIDNLIRNGLKYNDSATKFVKIYSEDEFICVVDNGRGLTQEDFLHLSKPYVRKENQKESGTGLGLNICIAILKEHGFSITAEKLKEGGTKLKIKIK
jgi:PAS domain S-box-containing protein